MGDNNIASGQGIPDEPALTSLVQPGWIVGVARGMLPWFGSVKLLLNGNAQEVPTQSWEFMGLAVAGLVGLALGFHYLLRAEGIEDPRRKAQEEPEEPDEAPPDHGRSWRHPFRSLDDEEDAPHGASKASHRSHGGTSHDGSAGGRPRPRIGRRPPRKDDDDSDKEL